MRVGLTGAGGQLGGAVRESVPPGFELLAWQRADFDLTAPDVELATILDRSTPSLIINAAAYTAVDRAESDEAAALAVNRDGVARLGRLARERGIPVIHVSTDYVFDGTADRPYLPTDPVRPLGAYGRSKWDGEERLREALNEHLILRVSWLFGAHGPNFVRTMLRLGAERSQLRVVNDQVGVPTPTDALASAIWSLVARHQGQGSLPWGTYHYGCHPVTTWHGFALAIFEEARAYRSLEVQDVVGIPSTDYPDPARRPGYSVLDGTEFRSTFGLDDVDWRPSLARLIRRWGGSAP